MRRGDNKSGSELSRVFMHLRLRDFLGSFVVADDRRPSSRQQPRKKTVAAADVQDALLVQIAKHLFDGGEMQPSAKRVIFDVVGVVLHSAEVGHGAILALRAFRLGRTARKPTNR